MKILEQISKKKFKNSLIENPNESHKIFQKFSKPSLDRIKLVKGSTSNFPDDKFKISPNLKNNSNLKEKELNLDLINLNQKFEDFESNKNSKNLINKKEKETEKIDENEENDLSFIDSSDTESDDISNFNRIKGDRKISELSGVNVTSGKKRDSLNSKKSENLEKQNEKEFLFENNKENDFNKVEDLDNNDKEIKNTIRKNNFKENLGENLEEINEIFSENNEEN